MPIEKLLRTLARVHRLGCQPHLTSRVLNMVCFVPQTRDPGRQVSEETLEENEWAESLSRGRSQGMPVPEASLSAPLRGRPASSFS